MASESEDKNLAVALGDKSLKEKPSSSEKSLEYVASACPVRSVVVFLDRAEVCRVVEAQVQSGDHEILLKSLPSTIDEESIRVEGRGAVSITEVAFLKRQEKEESAGNEEGEPNDAKKEKTKLEELRDEKESVSKKLSRINEQRDALGGFADNLIAQAKGHHLSELVSSDSLDGIRRFCAMHDEQSSSLDDEMMELVAREKELVDEIKIVEKKFKERRVEPRAHIEEIRELSILLHAEEPGSVELYVSYVVTNAKWSPTYDIRVDSRERTMQIVYFGVVEQSTGEDWIDAKISLSTALPSVGGSAPELGTKHLKFQELFLRDCAVSFGKAATRGKKSGFSLGGSFRKKKRRAFASRSYEDSDSDENVRVPQAAVVEGITSATYEVEHKATILSDKTGHKVSVAVILMEPEFEHETVPRVAAHAFLKAKVKNGSQYAFLPGQANVFLDTNFITKTSVGAVSPGEDFECFLGADPAVRVTYKPFRKFQEQAGIVSKSSVVTHEQRIEIYNGRPEPCKIKVSDQLPRSTEEKIKVKLIEPEIRKPDRDGLQNPRINESNNVEWQLTIEKSVERNLVLKYSVESPLGKEIEEKTVVPPKK